MFPLIVSIPHSGVKIPPLADWLKNIEKSILMQDVDAFVEDLYRPALVEYSIPSVFFEWHRYSVDVNRFASDISDFTVEKGSNLYPSDLEAAPSPAPGGQNRFESGFPEKNPQNSDRIGVSREKKTQKTEDAKQKKSPSDIHRHKTTKRDSPAERPLSKDKQKQKKEGAKQKKSPSDIHWHKTTKGDLLIRQPLSKKKHESLIKLYFDPFHKEIKNYIEKYKNAGNKNVYLLDLHSMPSQGLSFHRDKGERRKDIVIGDNEGSSCSKAFRDLVLRAYRQAGFETALNWPYKGGAVTQKYGRPELGQHCLQVELNRKLYMDEKTKRKNKNYTKVQMQLKKVMDFLIQNQKILKK